MSAILINDKCSDGKEHKKFFLLCVKRQSFSGSAEYKCSECECRITLNFYNIHPKDIPKEFENRAALLTYQQKIN